MDDFPIVRRRFAAILGPKTGPRTLLLRFFFENVDFLKIVLQLWWEHDFQGSELPKNDPDIDSERQRGEETRKIGSGAFSGRTFSAPGPFSVDFWAPAESQNEPKRRSKMDPEIAKLDFWPVWGSREAPGAI